MWLLRLLRLLCRHSLDCPHWAGTAKGVSFLPSAFAPTPCSSLAKWETAFSDTNTHKEDFHVTPKQTIQVLMMNREDEYHYLVDRDISCTVVMLPYQGNSTALFVLPNEGKMQQVENGLNEGALKNWLKTATKRYFLNHAGVTSLHPCLGRHMTQDNTGMGSDGGGGVGHLKQGAVSKPKVFL